MDALASPGLWASPMGIAMFFASLGVLLWGVSNLRRAEATQAEIELKAKQFAYERKREEEA